MSRGLLFAMMAFLSASAAQAAPVAVPFNEPPASQARKIVNVVLSDYITSLTGVQIGVSVMDLDKDGTGEIIARFVHSGACKPGMEECRTVFLRYDADKNWQIILDKTAKQVDVDLDQGAANRPAPVTTDGVTWVWSYPSYKPDFTSVGDPVGFEPLPSDLVNQIAPAFGAGAAKLAKEGGTVSFEYAQPPVADSQKTILVRMNGLNACGALTGCPMRLLVQNEKSWTPVLQASTESDVALSKVKRGGFRDIVVSTQSGVVVMGWNGTGYAIAERMEQSIAEKKR
jgi:hypothetical protein